MDFEPALLADSRMVLCLTAMPAVDVRALADLGIPAVGLEPARATSATLAPHRHKFDAVVADLDTIARGARADVLGALDEVLAPGGRLVLQRDGATTTERKAPLPPPAAPGLVVGPYADLFVGCSRVVELGAGRGRFLDALALRGAQALGIEQDPDAAAAARGAGHEVQSGGLPELAACRRRETDGVFVGNVLERVPRTVLPALLSACRAALPPHGRCVLRAAREVIERDVLPAAIATDWAGVKSSRVPRDPRDAAVLLRPAATPPTATGGVPELPLPTADLAIDAPLTSLFDLERCERRVTSQTGEDGVLAAIFAHIGTTNRFYAEFGCGDGVQCNTRQLALAGWQGVLMDGAERPGAPDVTIHAHWITADNIEALLDAHGVPAEPDLLSIDLDGNDYWVFRAIARRPRVLVLEYNGNLAADRALTIPYDPDHRWDGSDYYGASLLALTQLARTKGYTLVCCSTSGVNAFFVRDDVLHASGERRTVAPAALFRPANYFYRGGRSRPDLDRAMVTV